MSISTISSFIAGLLLIGGSIVLATDNPLSFYSLASIFIVVGGTISALFISYDFKTASNAIKSIVSIFFNDKDSSTPAKYDIAQLIDWAYTLQKSGLQGLENEITKELREEEPFLAYGADLVITGYTGPEIQQILTQKLESDMERNNLKVEALNKMGGDAPAFGMLGTLIGLIIMLGSMNENPAEIGPNMAIALITTFYGIILSRFICIPAAAKISERCNSLLFRNTLQTQGLVLLAERKSPRYIQDKINSFVESENQFSIDESLRYQTIAASTEE